MAIVTQQAQRLPIDTEGTGIISTVLLNLLNEFPGLAGREISFSTLGDADGIAFFPSNGAVFLSNSEDITGHVRQVCLYPFEIVYRSAPKSDEQKIRIKEFLDMLLKWLEQQPVTIDGVEYQLSSYPAIEQGRVIKNVARNNPAHLNAAYQDGIEDWIIAAQLRYEAEYDK